MLSHAAVSNTLLDINQRYGVDANDRVLGLAELSFDLSVYDFFGATAAGAQVVLPDPARGSDRSVQPAHRPCLLLPQLSGQQVPRAVLRHQPGKQFHYRRLRPLRLAAGIPPEPWPAPSRWIRRHRPAQGTQSGHRLPGRTAPGPTTDAVRPCPGGKPERLRRTGRTPPGYTRLGETRAGTVLRKSVRALPLRGGSIAYRALLKHLLAQQPATRVA